MNTLCSLVLADWLLFPFLVDSHISNITPYVSPMYIVDIDRCDPHIRQCARMVS